MLVNGKLITHFIFSIGIAMGLIACGGDGSGGASVLSAEITGDTNESYAATKPIVECDQDVFEIKDDERSSWATIQIDIPKQLLQQGEHTLIGIGDRVVSNRVFSFNKNSKLVRIAYDALNERNYGKNVKGTISLTSIPKKIGEHLIGHLKATAQIESYGDVAKRTINIDLKFDIVANKSTFHLCE